MPDSWKPILPPREIDWERPDPDTHREAGVGPPIPKGPPSINLIKVARGLAKLFRGD